MTVTDTDVRLEALDPQQSFCVSAPAGSGKTGLLVQRYMRLLARVPDPERVVAITFTRKAAAEMRARVRAALVAATQEPSSADEHQLLTRQLARELLARDCEQGWKLLENPSRLRVLTIDAFCGELVRQMPLQSGCGGPLAVTDNATALYRDAFESFMQRGFGAGSSDADDLRELLLHLDNDWEQAAELLTGLLARRDQWLPLLGGAGLDEQQRSDLLLLSEMLVSYRIDALRALLAPMVGELSELLAYRHANSTDRPLFDVSSPLLAVWLELVDLLLTSAGAWRKKLDKRDGFPAGKGAAQEMKQRALALLAELRERDDPALLFALRQLRWLPDTHADETQWERLRGLSRILPRLSAQLMLVFQQRGEVDHAQIAMAAIDALGSDATPTELALRLDYRVDHLLVDEFQDTSSGQFELLRRLTRGWAEENAANPDKPRTLFLVGDPMQSIYGFREANVGLFIKARDEGVGGLRLAPLQLRMNFRSSQTIVNWVNTRFAGAFPPVDDEQLGAVSYSESVAARAAGPEPTVRLFAGDGAPQAEADGICERILVGLQDPAVNSIAVLGRTRRQLQPVIAALHRHGIEFAALDIDPLAGRPLIEDLMTLCGVLGNHADRFAWLSLLRSPAVALDHADLLLAAQHVPLARSLLAPGEVRYPAGFSTAGRARLAHLQRVLRWAEHYRDRLALRVWVEESWLRLGGAACAPSATDQEDAEQFFQLLERLEQQGSPFGNAELEDAVATLFAAEGAPDSRVQVMTLHKAKGLEFDWVFLPALGQSQPERGRELMLWDELVVPGGPAAFLLDLRPQRGAAQGNRLYDYLREQRREKRRMEAVRLFYVGCTRAMQQLHLSAVVGWDEEGARPKPLAPGSPLAALGGVGEEPPCDYQPGELSAEGAGRGYRRLEDLPAVEATPPSALAGREDLSSNLHARSLGTAVHRALESLVYRDTLPPVCDGRLEALLRATLLAAGCEFNALDELTASGREMLDRVLADRWARWMLDPERPERHAEQPITLVDDSEPGIRQLVVDYSFLDEASGERWIVDYKTASPGPDDSEEHFLAQQLHDYAEQLGTYREALGALHPQPIRCALYFPALGRHAELS